ncbi:MAG TPA: hypothetical protein PLT45_10780 [Smithella sp.]|nr:hypothetical protein [Smithella sp.]
MKTDKTASAPVKRIGYVAKIGAGVVIAVISAGLIWSGTKILQRWKKTKSKFLQVIFLSI